MSALIFSILSLILLLIGLALLNWRYRRDLQAARQRLDALDSRLLPTAAGPTEVALYGQGPPVLLIHGNGGGFDQGLDLAQAHLGAQFQAILPSRFGYLRTPLPEQATPASQADALAALLDALDIEKAAVMTYSAGGPSAVQLALRHPGRVSALVLISTAISDQPFGLPPRPVIRALFGSDFLTWLLTNPLRPLLQRMFVPASYQLSAEERQQVGETMQLMLPASPRAAGVVFDMFTTNTHPSRQPQAYPLEEIAVPTLIINAVDDPAASYAEARAMAARIPQSRLVTLERGGHLLLGSGDRVRRVVQQFLWPLIR